MNKPFDQIVFGYAETVKPGELVLVEYTSREPVYLLLYEVIEYVRLNGMPFVIVDVLDGLHVMKTHLRLAGIDTAPLDNAPVIKVGGNAQVGNILVRIDELAELSILKGQFMKVLRKIQTGTKSKPLLRVIVGATEFLQQLEVDPMKKEEFLAGIIRPIVGAPYTRGLVLVNRKRIMRETLGELEEISTHVLSMGMEDGKLSIRVMKSVYFDEYGAEVNFDPGDMISPHRGVKIHEHK